MSKRAFRHRLVCVPVAIVAAWALAAASAQATIIFSDDFDNDAVGGNPDNPPWNLLTDSGSEGGGEVEVLADSSNLFGEGASNRMVRVLDNSSGVGATTVGAANAFATQTLATFRFDFYEPSSGGSDGFSFRPLSEDASAVYTSPNFIYSIDFDDGAIVDFVDLYSLDELQHVDVVVNNTASSLSYLGGSQSLNAWSADVWLNGALVAEDVLSNATGNSMRGLGFISARDPQDEFYFDNVVVRDEVYIVPEPATLSLLAVGALLGAIATSRRRRTRV